LFYIPTWENTSSIYFKSPVEYVEGRQYTGTFPRMTVSFRGGVQNQMTEDEGYGAVHAMDPKTGERKWEFKMADVTESGILTTASDLLFVGGREGNFFALNARNGSMLWKAVLGGNVASGPISYSVNGRQYIAVAAGNSLFAFALRQ
jgi:alcohol dehydrogenase (cytochrome c)